MHRFSFGFVFGMIVLIIGASMAFDALFGIHFPLVPLALAALLVIWGARMVAHAMSRRDRPDVDGEAWLADRTFSPTGKLDHDTRYDVVFGRGVVDLTKLVEPAGDVTIAVDTVFGTTVVKVDPALAYDIEGRSMFGEVRMPDRSMTAMGSLTYRSAGDHRPRIHLRVSTVFGACQIVDAAA
jgi:predicted membrane protein